MDDFRRYPKGNTRQMVDFARFQTLTGEKQFLCLDKGVMEICRVLLNNRGLWRTTYYVSNNQAGYFMPTEEQFESVINAISEANTDMSNCEEINASLQDIVAAINGLGASPSSSGCGCIADSGQDVTEFNDNPTQDIPPDTELPPGFETAEEYNTYRCDAAHWIVDNYIQTLRNWAGLFGTVGGLTLAVISGLLLLTVPPAGLALILAAMGILVGLDIGLLAVLSEIADELEANKPNYICDIYNAATTGDARQALRDAALDAVTVVGPVPPGPFEQIVDNLISNEQMEMLFTLNAEIEGYGGDCSECEGGIWTDGTLPNDAIIIAGSYDGPTVTLESVPNTLFGFTIQSLDVITIGSPANSRLRITDVVTPGSGNWKYRFAIGGVDQGEFTGSNWADLETFDEVCSYLVVFSTDAGPGTPFTITLNLEP